MVLPTRLQQPFRASGEVACKIMLDLTIYLTGPSEGELEDLIRIYQKHCPPQRLSRYKIAEFETWASVNSPRLTASGRSAAAAGIADAYLEPVRRRIRESRALELRYWDGREIDAIDGSWSLDIASIKRLDSGLH